MAISDIFPATPLYPIEVEPRDRKIYREMQSGGVYERAQSNDIWRSDLHGVCSGTDLLALQAFRDTMAGDIFTLTDKSFSSGDVARKCKFRGPVRYRHLMHDMFEWNVLMEETTAA